MALVLDYPLYIACTACELVRSCWLKPLVKLLGLPQNKLLWAKAAATGIHSLIVVCSELFAQHSKCLLFAGVGCPAQCLVPVGGDSLQK